MKRLLALAAGVYGLWAMLRRRYRRRAQALPESSAAAYLRARLAESRAAEEVAPAEPAPAPPAPETALESRRRDVHERARQSIDELA